jgi:hypothetical protein
LGWLPVFVGGEKFKETVFGYNLPKITRNLMAISSVGMILCAILSLLILPKAPKEIGILKKFSILLQWVLLPITLIAFGSIPALDAQTRLLLGKYMGFWTTEKYRKNE